MYDVGFNFEGLEEITEDFRLVKELYPKEIKRFMQREGTKLRNRTRKKAQSSGVKKHTGNYLKGIKRGKYYKYQKDIDSIRVYAGKPAYHAHWIEEGHETSKKRTKAFHVFSQAIDEYKPTFEKNCEDFAEKILKTLD